ncbi:MAG TPA: hypothetical protein VK279_07245 [Solirubrobacteraceae bacterium]|nr:hypothetical protein [Solirubrobacteraceae bacterium]
MSLDRQSIVRSDFPTARRGYRPEAVAAHLRAVADRVEALQRPPAPRSSSVAFAASEQVREIIEAAEGSAEEMLRQARAEAAGVRAQADPARAAQAMARLAERVEAVDAELDALLTGLRERLGRVGEELSALGRDTEELRAGGLDEASHEELEPAEAVAEPEVGAPVEDDEELVAARAVEAEPDEEPLPAGETAAVTPDAVEAPAAGNGESRGGEVAAAEDEEGARLIALNMALSGSPREETDRYLAEHFAALGDRGALLDEVYASAGS